MFTGIIVEVGMVYEIQKLAQGARIKIFQKSCTPFKSW